MSATVLCSQPIRGKLLPSLPLHSSTLLAILLAFLLNGQSGAASYLGQSHEPDPLLPKAAELFQDSRWEELVQLVPDTPALPADLLYFRGMALARLQRWEEARVAFEKGQDRFSGDKRFAIELAGVAFKTGRREAAATALRRALKVDPEDSYTLQFLGTLYLLNENLDAALKFWNRIDKPRIEEVRWEPTPHLKSDLLDRAFTLSPATLLTLRDLDTTRARLEKLEAFTRFRFDLAPQPDQNFDLIFSSVERNGLGNGSWDRVFSVLKGVPYLTAHLDLFNLRRAALNSRSFLRWDAQKRRLYSSFSGPWRNNPAWHFQLALDGRRENWSLVNGPPGTPVPPGDLHLRKESMSAGLGFVPNGRLSWDTGFELSHRRLDGLSPNAGDWHRFRDGTLLRYRSSLDFRVLRLPERRLEAIARFEGDINRFLSPPRSAFGRIQSALRTRWLPQAKGDDYAIQLNIRSGSSQGSPPLDELFVLGMERDNHLWLRAHPATRHGKKGSGWMGRHYLLLNSEFDKAVWQQAFFQIRAAPFLDIGKMWDGSGGLGSPVWLWDAGLQLKIRVLGGPAFVFSYGKDLQTGRSVFYSWLSLEKGGN
ncbi:MAG: tetratricopeptide repeat protein [Acidobacteriota bacterium]